MSRVAMRSDSSMGMLLRYSGNVGAVLFDFGGALNTLLLRRPALDEIRYSRVLSNGPS